MLRNLLLVIFISSVFLTGKVPAQSKDVHFSVEIPSIEQEASSVWRTINEISFFEQQSYSVNLPEHKLIDDLVQKSKRGEFGSDDYPAIYQLIESEIFDSRHYESAFEIVTNQAVLINSMINELNDKKSNWDWEFKSFKHYKVVLTLYGSGGSYNPDYGVITLFTNEQGHFKKYENPANTIIHEIVHIGIEESIVQNLELPHGTKERVVDHIVFLMFSDVLTDYLIQEMGNTRLDEHLNTVDDISKLHLILQNQS